MSFNFPEEFKLVLGGSVLPIQAANALSTGDYICCKNVQKAWAVITHQGANDTDLVLEFSEATDVAGSGAADVTKTVPNWRDNDAGTGSDTLVKQTDAATVTIDPATQNPVLVVMEWDPAKFTAGYDCIAVKGNNGHGSNNVHVLWILEMRYADNQPPSVIID
jgi:hypothetical protein